MEQRDAGLLGIGALGGVVGGFALATAVREVMLLVRRRAVVGP